MSKHVKGKSVDCGLSTMLGVINTKMDLLAENMEKLKKEMKEAIEKQNSVVVDVLAENTVTLKKFLKTQSPKYCNKFPIKTVDEMFLLEESINESNEQEFAASIRAIIGPRGLKKMLPELILPEVLVKFNLEGIHNKKRFFSLTKFVNVLFLATFEHNSNEKAFKDELRAAIKLAKNRFFKGKCASKKKNTEQDQDIQEAFRELVQDDDKEN